MIIKGDLNTISAGAEIGKTTATSVNISKSGAMTDVILLMSAKQLWIIVMTADKITTLGGNAVIKGDLNTKSGARAGKTTAILIFQNQEL